MASLLVRTATGEHRLAGAGAYTVRAALEATEWRVPSACGGVGACGTCTVRVVSGPTNPLTTAEHRKLTAEERARGLRLACQLRLEGNAVIELDTPVPSRWQTLPEEDLAPCPGRLPELQGAPYGVAVDLGTTHLRVALWDRQQGRRIGACWGMNPQGVWGADVLNRLSLAQTHPQRGREMAECVRAAVLSAVHDLFELDAGPGNARWAEIGRLVVVGNPAMLALLTEQGGKALLDPANWQQPIDYQPRDPAAWRAQWHLPHLEPLLPGPVAGFVGSDLLASVLATRLLEGPAGSLLLDVGTNTEIALWDGQALHVTSVPGGPAFEGVGLRFGMAAEPGAISRVSAQPGGGGFVCETLGGLPIRGYCGSGLIDAVAVLLEAGHLKPSGRFTTPPGAEGFALDPASPRSALSAADVDAVQRAKAATAAAMAALLELAGMRWRDLGRLCVCGAFGRHLDLGHAQAVGLLPRLATGRIELHANAALTGCERALLAADAEAMFFTVAGKIKMINLSFIQGWEDRYISHLRLEPIPLFSNPRDAP
jgi:uncharacterized 2Fe-2S/4Fe-4S cluster protein (DUF4445 family)